MTAAQFACMSPGVAGLDAGPGDTGPQDPCLASDLDGDGYGTDPLCPRTDCDEGNFGVHPGATEACNGLDEDCDGEIDEDLGESFCGVGVCRGLVPNCVDGKASACIPNLTGNPETCNGLDDDCDGEVDEGLITESCGVGACQSSSACIDGAWSACVPGQPQTEVCNRIDDDCNGVLDDGFGVRVEQGDYRVLSGLHPECDGAGQRMGPACNAAIHRYCAASDCGSSGFGPIENSGDVAVLTCTQGPLRNVSFAQLAGIHASCEGTNQVMGPDCNAAMHRFCVSEGFVSGYGPTELTPGGAQVACVGPEIATVVSTTYTALSGHHAGCTAARRWGPDCNAAISRFCSAQGHRTGFGPVENSGDGAAVVCVRP